MSGGYWLIALLLAGVGGSLVRLVLGHVRAPRALRPAAWRTWALAALTIGSAGLLYRVLMPPPVALARDTLVVLTAGADLASLPPAKRVVALPEAADLPPGAHRAPDLATALRRHPDVRALQVFGAGLEARDRDAVGARALAYVPAALPAGIVELAPPVTLAPGARFEVRGRVEGIADARLSLLDPAGRTVDVTEADETGRFLLAGTARESGAATFVVAVQDMDPTSATRVPVPVVVEAAAPVRLLLLAAAPNPDVRALRRWAEDAGLSLRWRVMLGGGTAAGDAPPLDAASLAGQDLVLLEARAWDALGAGARAALRTAVNDGLGLLVHAPQPPSDALRSWLREAGLAVEVGRTRDWRVDAGPGDSARLRAWLGPGRDDAPFDPALADETLPALGVLPIASGQPGATAGGSETMRWDAVGRGRIGLVTVADSWQLALAGRADLHAALWSGWAGTLARPGGARSPAFEDELRVDRRWVVCDLGDDATLLDADGRPVPLLPDASGGGCAGVWPARAGWHRLLDGETSWPVYIRDADEASGLHAARLRAETQALVRAHPEMTGTQQMRAGSSWPWFFAWLVVTALAWALGRARVGRSVVSDRSAAG
ncbi:carboxypeptidase regulatory-like domain-containing protein [Luteimonas deserti]|uniref:Carboxypeptidase regulatory-like domain-containing protein n=1 Tax=Luteimonas deserti TaxID=2752306 RepID=A0A7Z0QS71_9GAMM|nr:carboxypeptidase regulatory-like domain-containing protein [Luteimonas deserti]NYZ63763.1 carboxypeptidase regulatory-like domain-containing protein [Luteimonas deserti]